MSDLPDLQDAAFNEVADKLFKGRDELIAFYDARYLFAVYTAIIAQLGADLIKIKAYKTSTVMRLIHEAVIGAVTIPATVKHVIYMKDGQPIEGEGKPS
jgi:hypothetical protein